MKAAVVTDFRAPLQILDLPMPESGPGPTLAAVLAGTVPARVVVGF
ncbi:hypothetical protein [Mycolicibacterium sp.]|nr:hypothetical protein [Mycolicibacterium sp.]MBJ7336113.1 hypothetical protein [Mycolicibacterium sp.]